MNVLLLVTGSVSAVKIPELALELKELNYRVKIAATKHGNFFLKKPSKNYDSKRFNKFEINFVNFIHLDSDEWGEYKNVGVDEVLHIELRKWADVVVLCPLSANSLAKIANGISDNLVTSVLRALSVDAKLVLVPAMNTMMWDSPFTGEHLTKVQQVFKNSIVVPPVTKKLACNDVGYGAMNTVKSIIEAIVLLSQRL